MDLFTSEREKRLWGWVLLVTLLIYSTLGPAQLLVAKLRALNLLRISIYTLVAIGTAIIGYRWVKLKPNWTEIGVVAGAIFMYLIVWLRIELPEERTHLIEYGLLASLIHKALQERQKNGIKIPFLALFAILLNGLIGCIDETIQLFLPNRFFDYRDIIFNGLAGFMVISVRGAIAWVRNRKKHTL